MVVLVPLCWLSGFVVYSNHDGRWGRLAWVIPGDWIDIHGTLGVLLWPLALLFALYALSLGRSRLNQAANAAALLALASAVVSGKLMDEAWLRTGQLDQLAYSAHLTAWLLIAAAVTWHLAAVLRRGGRALASSMLGWQVRASDQPRHWASQVKTWFQRQA
jgi:hypothetical protein